MLAIITTILVVSALPPAYAEFSFQNQFSYVNDTRVMHVLGEIRNESDMAMGDILITISFYDDEGNLLDKFQRLPSLRVINPGESSPFEILYIDPETVDNVANFTMSAEGQETEIKEKQLKIISSNSRLDLLGTYYINAAARNEGVDTATNTILIATLYDGEGKVVAIGRALAEAGPGSANITAGSQAPFGITITDKLQTYKAEEYSLVIDSDQYLSETVFLPASGAGLSAGNQTQSGCLIATAAYGSELAPQVQQLRLFRDAVALKTSAGSSFMQVFHTWYYSFSPSVADYERETPWLQIAVRVLIQPLLGILAVSTSVFDLLSFSSELGIVSAGIAASSMIGFLYFAPFGTALGIVGRKRRWTMSKVWIVLSISWAGGFIAMALDGVITTETAMMVGTSLIVLSAISTAVVAVARAIRW